MRGFFHRQSKFQPADPEENGNDQSIPDDLWVKCPGCSELLYSKELNDNLRVCPKCEHHFRLRARERESGGIAPVLGAWRVPHRTPVEGLWFVGAQSESGGGVGAVMAAAFKTARRVAAG